MRASLDEAKCRVAERRRDRKCRELAGAVFHRLNSEMGVAPFASSTGERLTDVVDLERERSDAVRVFRQVPKRGRLRRAASST